MVRPKTGYKTDRRTWEAILYAEVALLGNANSHPQTAH